MYDIPMPADCTLNTPCVDLQAALNDEVAVKTNGEGIQLRLTKLGAPGPRLTGVNYCPWCGCDVSRGLYGSSAMLYRP